MKITPYIIKKPTSEEIKKHTEKEFEFMLAVLNKDINILKELLCDNGVFFGQLSKWQVLYFFKDQFNKWQPEDLFGLTTKIYIATGSYLGKRAIMLDGGSFPVAKKTKKPKTLILDIENEKITAINICYKYLEIEEINQLSENN